MSESEYGIKYKKIKIANNEYLLIPEELIEGTQIGDDFYSSDILKVPAKENIETASYLVDNIATYDEIHSRYDFDELDKSFILDYYFEELKDIIIVAEVKNGMLIKKKLDVRLLRGDNFAQCFEMTQNGPALTINETLVNILLATPTLEEMREKLKRMKTQLQAFSEKNKEYGTTRILVKDGKIVGMEDNGERPIVSPEIKITESTKKDTPIREDFSEKGLEAYLKERIIGHNDEIEEIATILMRNLSTNAKKEDVESILIIGPTGTGKTITFKTISEYLQVPFREINTPSLVPEGIVGKTLNDYLFSLLEECNGDTTKAVRSILFFDEFDKIAKGGTDVKQEVLSELYKLMEGAQIQIKKNYLSKSIHTIDTGFISRVYSGVFEDGYKKSKPIGFGNTPSPKISFDLDNLFRNSVFNKELFDRIHYKYLYDTLSREDKKRIILESKLSHLIKKKEMLERIYGITLEIEPTYVEAILDLLESDNRSIRDLNNIISGTIIKAEREIAQNPKQYKKLILTQDTVSDNKQFTLT